MDTVIFNLKSKMYLEAPSHHHSTYFHKSY